MKRAKHESSGGGGGGGGSGSGSGGGGRGGMEEEEDEDEVKEEERDREREGEEEEEAPVKTESTRVGEKRKAEAILLMNPNPQARGVSVKPGSLIQVRMTNLRCHPLCTVPLGPSTNFIGGGNGSGKSTVLLAIQLALGMKVPEGGGVIRSGSGSKEAIAEVTLHNAGSPGTTFRPHLYGDTITITRVLKASLGESKAAQAGKVSATLELRGSKRGGGDKVHVVKGVEAKGELAALCSLFNIAHDNPVMVMDQETSKKFLTGNPVDQYEYFLKATSLKVMYEEVCSLNEKLRVASSFLDTHKGSLQACEAHAKEREQEWMEVQELSKFDQRISDAKVDILWASFQEHSKGGESKRKEAEATAQMEVDAQQRRDKLEVGETAIKARVDAANKALEAAKEKSAALLAEMDAAKKKLKVATAPVSAKSIEVNAAKDKENKARRKLEDAEKALKRVESQIAAATSQSRLTKAQQARDNAQARHQACAKAQEESTGGEEERMGALEAASQQVGAAKKALETARQVHKAAKERLARLTDSKAEAHPLTAYEHSSWYLAKDAAAIAHLIKANARAFKVPPKGPLGSLLRIKDTESLHGIEMYARNSILTFICESSEDARSLEALVREKGGGSLINSLHWTTSPPIKDAPTGPPPPGSILANLVVEDPSNSVLNAVCCELKAHSTLLVKEAGYAAANAAMGSKGFSFALCPDTTGRGNYLAVSKKGGATFSETLVSRGGASGFIRCVSAAAEIAGAKAALKAAEEGVKERESQVAAAEASYQAAEGESRVADKAKREAGENMKKATKALMDATAELRAAQEAADSHEDDSKHQDALGEVEEARGALEAAQGEREEAEEAREAFKPAMDAAQAEFDKLSKSNVLDEEAAAAKALRSAEDAQAKVEATKDAFDEKLENAQEAHRKARAAWDSFKANLEVSLEQTRKSTGMEGPRPGREGQTVTASKGALEALKKSQDREMKRLGSKDKDEVRKACKEALSRLATERAKNSDVLRNHEMMLEQKKQAIKKFKDIRQRACEDIDKMFQTRLASKGHKGMLEFIHPDTNKDSEHGEIRLRVIADASASGKMGLNVKDSGSGAASLSGGEKSLISLILLSAISSVSNPPFRIIDEFDVYQDEGTRKKSLQYIMEDAARKGEDGMLTQFVLLTPHDVSQLGKDFKLDVKSFTMPDPKRHTSE